MNMSLGSAILSSWPDASGNFAIYDFFQKRQVCAYAKILGNQILLIDKAFILFSVPLHHEFFRSSSQVMHG